jgi:hypothetical protein
VGQAALPGPLAPTVSAACPRQLVDAVVTEIAVANTVVAVSGHALAWREPGSQDVKATLQALLQARRGDATMTQSLALVNQRYALPPAALPRSPSHAQSPSPFAQRERRAHAGTVGRRAPGRSAPTPLRSAGQAQDMVRKPRSGTLRRSRLRRRDTGARTVHLPAMRVPQAFFAGAAAAVAGLLASSPMSFLRGSQRCCAMQAAPAG